MTSITSSTDPVKTVIDLLENTTNSDWVNVAAVVDDNVDEKPEVIERMNDRPMSKKTNVMVPALYVYSPEDAQVETFGAVTSSTADNPNAEYIQREVVAVDIWVPASQEAVLDAYASDVTSIMDDYRLDEEQNTVWWSIRWRSIADNSAQTNAAQAAHVRTLVTIDLERIRDVTA